MTHVHLTWHDPISNQQRNHVQPLPLIIGRNHQDNAINIPIRILSRQHTRLFERHGTLHVEDLGSRNGTLVHGEPIAQPTPLVADGLFLVGTVEFRASFAPAPPRTAGDTLLLFDPHSDRLRAPTAIRPDGRSFPPELFDAQIVPTAALPVDTEETAYLAVGGGIGSFVWVNHLLVYGANSAEITVIGLDPLPYARYKRLCENSQIPAHERLRSNSDATPDNLWGWPGYAVREMWRDAARGNLTAAAKIGWHIFNEPFAETYTPQAKNVFAAIDREAARIGWHNLWRKGRVRAVRKTDDGRYVVAYSQPQPKGKSQHRLILCRYLHLAVGYPGVRFLPDLQRYRQLTGDAERVVNAYEAHDHVYRSLQDNGGTVILRGRGIVASRIVQRLYEIRESTNMPIRVVHLMRSPNQEGNTHRLNVRRATHHGWEYQPFNWPKAMWGGDLQQELAQTPVSERQRVLTNCGGTTTADRRDWRALIDAGLRDGWYEIVIGSAEMVQRDVSGSVSTCVRHHSDRSRTTTLLADYIIDATGLEADMTSNSLLNDLVTTYQPTLNPLGRFEVSSSFEIEDLRNGGGRLFACGVSTLGGPYAPVDSFLGLQYAAQRSADLIASLPASNLRPLNSLRSLHQWTRWARGVHP